MVWIYQANISQVDVNTMTNAKCSGSDTAYTASDITANMICARDTGKDSCQVFIYGTDQIMHNPSLYAGWQRGPNGD